jgi:hypothetical protein
VKVNGFLVGNYNDLFDVGFTAKMETLLDEVEDPTKQLEWQGMLADFYAKLKMWLADAKAPGADPDVVEAVLQKFTEVKEWAPPSKNGKRTFSDEKFVGELRETFRGGSPKKRAPAVEAEAEAEAVDAAGQASEEDSTPAQIGEISQNQLKALLNILTRYRRQLSGFEDFLKSIGKAEMLEDEKLMPPRPSTMRIFAMLDQYGIPEGSEKFYNSLRDQAMRGKRLSPKQRHYLERMFLDGREAIEGFSKELCESLEIEYSETAPVNTAETEEILAGLASVTTWKEPVKKGRRVYDDSEFYKSVATQFTVKKHLSEAQMKVLERMFLRYGDQIPDAPGIIAKYEIKIPARKGKKSAE